MKRYTPESCRPAELLLVVLRAFLLISGLAGPAVAQMGSVALSAPMDPREAFALSVQPLPDGSRVLRWEILEGYYLYREYIKVETVGGARVPLDTSAGTLKKDPTFGSVEVYYGRTEARAAPAPGEVRVTYQGCQEDGICYPPVTDTLSAIAVMNPSADTPDATRELTPDPASETALPDAVTAVNDTPSGITLADDEGMIADLMGRGGTALVLLGFFGFGLLLAFTPCVLPMIPILGGLLAGQGATLTARRGLALSGTYVLAMSSALALLGVAAAWSGQNLQIVLQSPWALGGVAALFAILALSMFGLFELRLPQAWNARLSAKGPGGRGTFGGAAALGFTSALIMGPCVTAPLAGALLYIAQTGDTLLGAAALFSLGLGEGVPLLLMGAFGASALPRAGQWMQVVNRIFGFVFLGMAAWLAARIVPPAAGLALWAAVLVVVGVFFGGFDRLEFTANPATRLRKAAGVIALFAAAFMGLGAASGGSDPFKPLVALRAPAGKLIRDKGIDFVTVKSLPELDTVLAETARPTMIYFTAEWCVSCRSIERRVWPDVGVQAALADMHIIAADLTEFNADSQALLDGLRAVGPPTMIFLDATGQEATDTRLVGEPGPQAVIASAEEVQ